MEGPGVPPPLFLAQTEALRTAPPRLSKGLDDRPFPPPPSPPPYLKVDPALLGARYLTINE